MGQAKQRKDAGTYPTIDGRQPSKEKRTGMKFDPTCTTCHGTGKGEYVLVQKKGAPAEYVAKTCNCSERMMDPATKEIIQHGTGLGLMKRAAIMGLFSGRRAAEGKE